MPNELERDLWKAGKRGLKKIGRGLKKVGKRIKKHLSSGVNLWTPEQSEAIIKNLQKDKSVKNWRGMYDKKKRGGATGSWSRGGATGSWSRGGATGSWSAEYKPVKKSEKKSAGKTKGGNKKGGNKKGGGTKIYPIVSKSGAFRRFYVYEKDGKYEVVGTSDEARGKKAIYLIKNSSKNRKSGKK